jgi:phage gp36-like protein
MDDPQLVKAISQASDVIDGYLVSRYTVPFTDPYPTLIVTLTEAIAAYFADLTFRQGVDYDSNLDPVYLRCQWAKETLTDIHDGKVDIPGLPDGGGGGVVVGGATIINGYQGRLFWPTDFDLIPDWQSPGRWNPAIGWF